MIKNRPNYGNNKFIGKCIYCEATKDLEKEHAIPFGLKGGSILQKASRRDCARITTKFEDSFLRKTNLGMRTVQKMPTRHPKKRPTELPMIFIRGSEKCEEMVPIEDYVPVLILPELGPPGVLDGLEHVGGMESGEFRVVTHTLTEEKGPEHVRYLLSKYKADDVEVPFEINHDDFRRLIAKIAHCRAIQFYGFDGFERFNLINSILGRTDNHFEFVGGDGRHDIHETWDEDSTHVVGFRRVNSVEVYVRVKLWNRSRTPEYIAAVGTLRRRYAAFLDFHQVP